MGLYWGICRGPICIYRALYIYIYIIYTKYISTEYQACMYQGIYRLGFAISFVFFFLLRFFMLLFFILPLWVIGCYDVGVRRFRLNLLRRARQRWTGNEVVALWPQRVTRCETMMTCHTYPSPRPPAAPPARDDTITLQRMTNSVSDVCDGTRQENAPM